MIALQYIGGGLVSALLVWGLYSLYWFAKLVIAINKDPYKKHLVEQLSMPTPEIGVPGPMLARSPQIGRLPTETEIQELRKKHVEAQRRHHRHHAAEALLAGQQKNPLPIVEVVEHALALAEELEKQNAARPLPENPHGEEDASYFS